MNRSESGTDAGISEQIPRTTHFLPGLEDCVGLVGAQRLQPVSGVDPGQARADHDDIEIGAHESSVEYPHPWWALNLLERCLRAPYCGKYNSTGGERFRQRMLRREKRAEDDGYLNNDPSKHKCRY